MKKIFNIIIFVISLVFNDNIEYIFDLFYKL